MTSSVESATSADLTPEPNPAALVPPGRVFWVVTLGAIVLALDTNTRGSLGQLFVTVPVWLLLAVAWLVRFALAVSLSRGRLALKEWAKWLAVPVALGLVFAVTRTDAVIHARFDVSRGALDEMATDVMSGGRLERGWVGLYDVGTVERTANGLWFIVDDSGLGRWGFAYAPAGEPKESDANYSPLWQGAVFEHFDGPWWIVAQEWD
ncbi:MAG: hypothetical protein ACJ77B_06685 [Chloroflexota bacterium]